MGEVQRTQGGTEEAVELISVVPKRAEKDQPHHSLVCPGPRPRSELPSDPQELSARSDQEGRGRELCWLELMSSW